MMTIETIALTKSSKKRMNTIDTIKVSFAQSPKLGVTFLGQQARRRTIGLASFFAHSPQRVTPPLRERKY